MIAGRLDPLQRDDVELTRPIDAASPGERDPYLHERFSAVRPGVVRDQRDIDGASLRILQRARLRRAIQQARPPSGCRGLWRFVVFKRHKNTIQTYLYRQNNTPNSTSDDACSKTTSLLRRLIPTSKILYPLYVTP